MLKRIILPILSALITIIALFHLLPWLAVISLVPLLYTFKNASIADAIKSTMFFSISLGLCLFSWIPASAGIFNGQWLSGVLMLIVFTLTLSIYFLLLFSSYRYLEKPDAIVKNALLLGAAVVVLDYIKDALFSTMPWFDFHFGNALAGSNYTIQLAELGGVYLLSFFVVFANVIIAATLTQNFPVKWAVVTLAVFIAVNVGLYHYRSNEQEGKEIKLNLLTENIDPRVKWEVEGNQLVNGLLKLSKKAASQPAAINVWTETVIPWTYLPDDDFVNTILQDCRENNALTLLGINTSANDHEVFDSAYLLTPKGNVLGRYDKNYPLLVVESNVKGTGEAFNHDRGTSVAEGKTAAAIASPLGKIGVYICNEASVPKISSALVASGADYLVNISNDGWFADTYLSKQHFYYNRLRAVESRRYVVANSNMGYSGVASANGDIDLHIPTKESKLTQVLVYKQNTKTLYSLFPFGMLLLSCILIINHKYNNK